MPVRVGTSVRHVRITDIGKALYWKDVGGTCVTHCRASPGSVG